MPSFQDFSLQPATCTVLASMGITEPTPIQAEAIPALLAGNDLVGQSATGSGKTLAYGIPLVERLTKDKRVVQALVLVPTRELAVQVNAVLSKLAASRRLTTALLVGGRPYNTQMSSLRYGSQIVVGTPGRVKDHLERGSLVLSQLRVCVLDEADQMLDSGFAPAIEDILTTTPETRQMALFSATMPDWVEKLQKKFLKNPVHISITPATGAESTIEQIAYQVPQTQKIAALCTLLHTTQGESTLIFGRTKFGVERLGKQLSKLGFTVGTLHGDKSQRAREDVLMAFRRGHVQTLLATNVAARGLDIRGIYQVINYELPESSELFTHRIGRTGRMGQAGKAITLLAPSDLPKWRRMSSSLGQAVALQRLVVDEEAMTARMLAMPEAAITPEREQYSEPRPERGRRPFTADQEREPRPARARQEFSPRREYERQDEQRPEGGRRSFAADQEREPRPERARKQFAPDQDRGRFARPRQDGPTAPRFEQRQDGGPSERPARTSAWRLEEFSSPERPSSGPERDGRGGADRQSRFERGTSRSQGYAGAKPKGRAGTKFNAPTFGATESGYRPGKKKSGVAPTGRGPRKFAAKRTASR